MKSVLLSTTLVSLLAGFGAAGQTPMPAGQGHHHQPVAAVGDAPASSATDARLDGVRQAMERYGDLEAARTDGFVRFGSYENPLVGQHWYREDLVDAPLDLARPSTLMYATLEGRPVLVGVAYATYLRPGDPMPEGFPGEDDRWHVHDVVAIAKAAVESRPVLRWIVDRRIDRGRVGRTDGRTHLVMLHAWPWIDNPDGAFADQHKVLPYVRAGLPADYAAGATLGAAWGITLLASDSCEAEIQRLDFVRPSSPQRRDLRDACGRAAASVAAALAAASTGAPGGAAELNRLAGAVWREFVERRDAVLTPQQRARLAAVVAHPH